MKNKKGDIEIEAIIKILIAVAVLFILVMSIWLYKDKLYLIWDKIQNVLRFSL